MFHSFSLMCSLHIGFSAGECWIQTLLSYGFRILKQKANIIQESILDRHKHPFYYLNLFMFYEFISDIKTRVQIQ